MSITNNIFNFIGPHILKKDIYVDILNGKKDKFSCDEPSKSQLRGVKKKIIHFKGRKIVCIEPKLEHEKKNLDIIFLHGGAYVLQASYVHWSMMIKLVKSTGATAYCIDYPLTPNANSGKSLEYVYDYYCKHLSNESRNKIAILGDSAGGGLALSLVMKIRDEKKHMPDRAILLSPYLDIVCSDSRQKELEKVDMQLSINGLATVGKVYAGNLPVNDWRISPIYGNINNLCPISLYTSNRDILHIDSLRLKEKLNKSNIPFKYHFEPNMIHDWIVYLFLPESKKALQLIVEELQDLISCK